MTYSDIMDKAETILAVTQASRRGLEAGRRESDLCVKDLTKKCRLLTEMNDKLLAIARGRPFTEQELNTLEMGNREVGIHE